MINDKSPGASTKRKAWITIGDAAYRQVKTVTPDAVAVDSRQLPSEKVHAIVVDDSKLATIGGAVEPVRDTNAKKPAQITERAFSYN